MNAKQKILQFLTGFLLLLIPFFASAYEKLEVNNVTTGKQEVKLKTHKGIVSIKAYAPHIIHVAISQNGEVTPTDAVIKTANKVSFNVKEYKTEISIETDSLFLRVTKNPYQIEFFDKDKNLITSQKNFFEKNDHAGFQIGITKNEIILGGGEAAIPTNRRGYRLALENQPHWGYEWGKENLNYSIPYFVSSSNYGIYFDNGAVGYADVAKADNEILEIASKGGENNFYFIYNSKQKYLQSSFASLVGNQPLPPRWALGLFMSRYGYENEDQAYEIVKKMKDAGYPVDAIIFDLYWFGDGQKGSFGMGNLDWYKPAFPNPEKMISDFKDQGIKTILITEPFFLKNTINYPEGNQKGYFAKDDKGETNIIEELWFGEGALIDIFKPEARDWFWSFYQKQIEIGVAGWWCDLGEPEKHPADIIHVNGKAEEVKNLFGHTWSKMLSDKYAENYQETRLFNLGRSGFAGTQRYNIFPWSGDVSRTWGGLRAQLSNLITMSLSNVPYISSDLGGFDNGDKNPELYLRWLQFGVFNPVFRPHGVTVPAEPIFYPDSIQDILKKHIELRYRMIPYNYTLAWEQATKGKPLASPLFINNNIAKSQYDIFDEYMWGDAFLVAPILEAGAKFRKVFLPQGIWFNYHNDLRYLGNSNIEVPVTLSQIPVFVKAGSFIPLANPAQSTDYYSSDTLEVHYYFDALVPNANYTMYEDDGLTRGALANGNFELLNFSAFYNKKVLNFDVKNEGKDFDGRPESRFIKLIVHHENALDGVVRDRSIKARVQKKSNTIEIIFDLQKDSELSTSIF